MENYKNTPSFYNTKEVFQKYLARTSYYTIMQDAVCKIVKHCNPKTILELGSGTGSTACRLAKENKNSFVMAVDMRENMVDIGQEISHEKNVDNIDFIVSEMVDYIEKQGELSEIIVMLYSFHHIPDPDENKIKFLRLCKSKLPKYGKICIAETFGSLVIPVKSISVINQVNTEYPSIPVILLLSGCYGFFQFY